MINNISNGDKHPDGDIKSKLYNTVLQIKDYVAEIFRQPQCPHDKDYLFSFKLPFTK
jgi:hypothetical protein